MTRVDWRMSVLALRAQDTKRHTGNGRAAWKYSLAMAHEIGANRIAPEQGTHGIWNDFTQGISSAPNLLPERVGARRFLGGGWEVRGAGWANRPG